MSLIYEQKHVSIWLDKNILDYFFVLRCTITMCLKLLITVFVYIIKEHILKWRLPKKVLIYRMSSERVLKNTWQQKSFSYDKIMGILSSHVTRILEDIPLIKYLWHLKIWWVQFHEWIIKIHNDTNMILSFPSIIILYERYFKSVKK